MADTRWLSHLDKEERPAFLERLRANRDLFSVLENIINKEIEAADKRTTSLTAFELHSWRDFQTFHLGMKKQAREILNLIKSLDR